MNQTKGQQGRNAGIECLRVLFMFMIVLDHCYEHGIYADRGGWLHYAFRSLLLWHVTGFVAISGWFGIRPSIGRFASVWGMMAFYSAISVVMHLLCPGRFPHAPFVVQGGWFAGCYLMLMCMAPLLNASIDALQAKGRRRLLLAEGLFASGMFLTWAPGHLFLGVNGLGFTNCTAAVMMFVYVTARVQRLSGPFDVRNRTVAVALLTTVALTTVCELVGLSGCGGTWAKERMLTYSTPWVMAFPMVLLMWAERVKVPPLFGRLAVWAGSLMFGIYLIHDATSFGRVGICALERLLADAGWPAGLVIPATAVAVFVLAGAVESVRSCVWKRLRGLKVRVKESRK